MIHQRLLSWIECITPSGWPLAGCSSRQWLPLRPQEPGVPKELEVPADHRVLLKAVGKGVQIYKAVESPGGNLVWTLEAPLANLVNDQGETIGFHYEGPSWEASDGSKVARDLAEPVRSTPAPNPQQDIPWLLIKVKPRRG